MFCAMTLYDSMVIIDEGNIKPRSTQGARKPNREKEMQTSNCIHNIEKFNWEKDDGNPSKE